MDNMKSLMESFEAYAEFKEEMEKAQENFWNIILNDSSLKALADSGLMKFNVPKPKWMQRETNKK